MALTKYMEKYIRKNSKVKLGSDIAKHLGISGGIVNRFINKHCEKMPEERFYFLRGQKNVKPFTNEEDLFIKSNLPVSSIKKIAKILKRTSGYVSIRAKELGLEKLIVANVIKSRIKPGSVPPNKGKKQDSYMTKEAIKRTAATRFKKGDTPFNTKERDGVITIRHNHAERGEKPYKYIRVSLGKWQLLHVYKWQKYRGKIHHGMCLWFKDGNTLNCTLKNLELITRAENLKRNRSGFLQLHPELRRTSTLLKKLNKKIYANSQQTK